MLNSINPPYAEGAAPRPGFFLLASALHLRLNLLLDLHLMGLVLHQTMDGPNFLKLVASYNKQTVLAEMKRSNGVNIPMMVWAMSNLMVILLTPSFSVFIFWAGGLMC